MTISPQFSLFKLQINRQLLQEIKLSLLELLTLTVSKNPGQGSATDNKGLTIKTAVVQKSAYKDGTSRRCPLSYKGT